MRASETPSKMLVWVLAALGGAHAAETPQTTPNIPRACVAPHDSYPFCDVTLPLEKRVDDLVSRLKLEEKPAMLTARESPLGNVSRLGIPEYDWGANCIHGVQSRCSEDGRCATSYPNPNFLGASFNRSVWHGMASVIGMELRALWLQGVGENHKSGLPHLGLDCWSPNININRDPRWGRNLETPSEDPLVCGAFGVAVSRGLQEGDDPRFLQAIVTLKHFDANSLEGPWGVDGTITRHTVDANISMYDLFASYLPAFQASVTHGRAAGIMCSYNSINGVPSCANRWLLQSVARESWGFDGYVTSDSGAVEDIYASHRYSADGPAAVAASLAAGCDIDSSLDAGDHATGSPYTWFIGEAVRRGELDEAIVDGALRRSLGMRFRLGLFDPIDDQPYWHIRPEVVGSEAHLAHALDASRQGFVLLQNGGGASAAGGPDGGQQPEGRHKAADGSVLPFRLPSAKVAVVGPHANDRSAILGNYLGQICADHFASVSCVQSPYEAISALAVSAGGAPSSVSNATGVSVNSTDTSGVAAALALAAAADVVVYVGGLDGTIEREGKDRHDLRLPGAQPAFVASLVALGKPTVLVLYHGGILTLPAELLAAPNLAIVSAGYPGVYGGRAIAETLFDTPARHAVNRFGLTPVTWYSTDGWQDAHFDMLSFDMTKYPGRTYRYYRGATPQWPFGFGLSYAPLSLRAAPDAPCDAARARGATETRTAGALTATVHNEDAQRASDAVVLAYVRPLEGTIPASEPASALVKTLVSFDRLGPIPPAGSASTQFTLSEAMATLHNAKGVPTFYPGKYEFIVATAASLTATLPFECHAKGGCAFTTCT